MIYQDNTNTVMKGALSTQTTQEHTRIVTHSKAKLNKTPINKTSNSGVAVVNMQQSN